VGREPDAGAPAADSAGRLKLAAPLGSCLLSPLACGPHRASALQGGDSQKEPPGKCGCWGTGSGLHLLAQLRVDLPSSEPSGALGALRAALGICPTEGPASEQWGCYSPDCTLLHPAEPSGESFAPSARRGPPGPSIGSGLMSCRQGGKAEKWSSVFRMHLPPGGRRLFCWVVRTWRWRLGMSPGRARSRPLGQPCPSAFGPQEIRGAWHDSRKPASSLFTPRSLAAKSYHFT